MDFSFSEEENAFRGVVRRWLQTNVDPGWREKCGKNIDLIEQTQREWGRQLHAGGWSGLWWPREFGGMDATPSQKMIFAEECALLDAPEDLGKLGKRLIGPVLMVSGTKEQQARFLPRILDGTEVWCQGFSEPDAGSDLLALRTKAEPAGEKFIVNGRKIWTSHARYSDWCFLLARSDPAAKRQNGLSLLLVKLDTPGIRLRRIKAIDEQHDFYEVTYDNVEVPAENLVGELHGGWQAATAILGYERGSESALRQFAGVIRALDGWVGRLDGSHGDDAALLGELYTRAFAIKLNVYRLLSAELRGSAPDEMASVVKLYSTETRRTVGANVLLAENGRTFAASDGSSLGSYLESRHYTISAGTSEIQRNTIARNILGLPSTRS